MVTVSDPYLFLNVDEHAGPLRRPISIGEFRIQMEKRKKYLELKKVAQAAVVVDAAVGLQAVGCGPEMFDFFLIYCHFFGKEARKDS